MGGFSGHPSALKTTPGRSQRHDPVFRSTPLDPEVAQTSYFPASPQKCHLIMNNQWMNSVIQSMSSSLIHFQKLNP